MKIHPFSKGRILAGSRNSLVPRCVKCVNYIEKVKIKVFISITKIHYLPQQV